MLEPYDGKLSRTVLRREGGGNTADPADYSPLVNRLKGQVIKISPNSTQFINPMDINANYSEGLLFFGNVILPFVDRFPTDLELYRIMTTKLGEVSEGAQK